MRKQLKPSSTRIMVFGTFDVVHPGHEDFFKQARRLASHPHLIVSVARDANVKKIKGRMPRNSEAQRCRQLSRYQLIDKIVLGNGRGYLAHIVKEKPDIIALGYDQIAYTQGLKQALAKRGLNVRIFKMKPYRPHKYKSSLMKK